MKLTILLLRIVLAAAGLLFFGRLGLLFFKGLREAITYSDRAYYDPTVFLIIGGFLLLPALLCMRLLVQYIRKNRLPRP